MFTSWLCTQLCASMWFFIEYQGIFFFFSFTFFFFFFCIFFFFLMSLSLPVFPIPIPPPTSLSTRSLQDFSKYPLNITFLLFNFKYLGHTFVGCNCYHHLRQLCCSTIATVLKNAPRIGLSAKQALCHIKYRKARESSISGTCLDSSNNNSLDFWLFILDIQT